MLYGGRCEGCLLALDGPPQGLAWSQMRADGDQQRRARCVHGPPWISNRIRTALMGGVFHPGSHRAIGVLFKCKDGLIGLNITWSAVSFLFPKTLAPADAGAVASSALESLCHTRRGSGFQPWGISGIGNLHQAQ